MGFVSRLLGLLDSVWKKRGMFRRVRMFRKYQICSDASLAAKTLLCSLSLNHDLLCRNLALDGFPDDRLLPILQDLIIVQHYCDGGDLAHYIFYKKKNKELIPETNVIQWWPGSFIFRWKSAGLATEDFGVLGVLAPRC